MFNSLIKPIVAVALVSTVAQAEPSRMTAITQGAQNAFGACVKYAQDHYSTATKVVGGVAVTTALGGVAYKLYNRKAKKPVVKTQVQKDQELDQSIATKRSEFKPVQPGFFARNKGKIVLGVTTVAALGAGYYFRDAIATGVSALWAKVPSVKMPNIFTNKAVAQVTEKVVEKTAETVAVETVKVAAKAPAKGMFVDGNVRVTEQR